MTAATAGNSVDFVHRQTDRVGFDPGQSCATGFNLRRTGARLRSFAYSSPLACNSHGCCADADVRVRLVDSTQARRLRLAEAIRDYLARHPDAADSAEGVAKWWLGPLGAEATTADTEQALL